MVLDSVSNYSFVCLSIPYHVPQKDLKLLNVEQQCVVKTAYWLTDQESNSWWGQNDPKNSGFGCWKLHLGLLCEMQGPACRAVTSLTDVSASLELPACILI